jgi:hypothetical protein
MEYIIYCDESDKKGPYFGNFYGGALVNSTDLEYVINTLEQQKILFGMEEIKWNKVSPFYLEEYKQKNKKNRSFF